MAPEELVLNLLLSAVTWKAIAIIAIIVSAGLAWGFIKSFIASHEQLIKDHHELLREKELFDARVAGYTRQIERRDAAIDASKCKDQIRDWIINPDKVPKPFDPFKDSPLTPKF